MKRAKTAGKFPVLWTILSVLCLILLIASIVGNYIASQYASVINIRFQTETTKLVADKSDDTDTEYFKSDYDSTEELQKADKDVAERLTEEGSVLLKNDNNTLPLETSESSKAKVSVFGHSSIDIIPCGTGSADIDATDAPTLKEALESRNLEVNDTLWQFYEDNRDNYQTNPKKGDQGIRTGDGTVQGVYTVNEIPWSAYSSEAKSSISDYNDAAIVVISRIGGEMFDIPSSLDDPQENDDGNMLSLTYNEQELLRQVSSQFSKTIVLINSTNAMEMDFMDQAEYGVDAALWIGYTGVQGLYGVADLLVGNSNPSGRLVDTYCIDNTTAPSMVNMYGDTWTNASDYTDLDFQQLDGNLYYNVYQEGIYVGYRYYETRYEDTVLGTAGVGNYDYASTVKYPFGYGLSYTNFAYSNFSAEEKDDSFDLHVTVTNTGDVAGKDVVEAYFQSPYTDYDKENGIEKSAVELCGFDKTKELKPGESQDITISVDKKELRTYDSNKAKTYIMDAGDYYFTAASDVHEALNNILAAKAANGVSVNTAAMTSAGDASFTYKWTNEKLDNKTYSVSNDGKEDYEITNQFDGADLNKIDDGAQSITYVSRSNWADTVPTEKVTLALSQSMHDEMTGIKEYEAEETDEEMPTMGKSGSMTLAQMIGKDYDDPDWDELLDQLTYEEMTELIGLGYHSTAAIASVAKPATVDENGPQGFTKKLSGVGGSICAYTDENIMAATWNVELMEEVGQHIGEDTMAAGGSGLYGPAMNTHRSPYAGRDFEYYSEDGFLAGKIAAAEVTGIQSKGVYVYIKHFALNDSETNCRCISTFANEQAIREIYLQPFEHAVIEGGAYNVMNAFARIGVTWCGASKNLMTNVLRNEWGLRGFGITDYSTTGKTYNVYLGVMAGTDTWDSSSADTWQKRLLNHEEDNDVALTLAMREASHRILYTVANSNAMNGIAPSTQIKHVTPWWQMAIYAVIALFAVLTAFFGYKMVKGIITWKKYKSNKMI